MGRDVRESSQRYFDVLTEGLRKGGVDIIDIGEVPTPVFYFAAKKWEIEGGVMITASHNPAEFNGFKILRGHGTIYGKDILELHTLGTEGSLPEPGGGGMTSSDVKDEYAEYIAANIKLSRPVRFAADGGNGTAGISAPDIFRRLGCNPVELYMDPDGTFPNHHPDPTVEKNLVDLREAVLSGGLELGIGFDGDSDRIGVVDDRGRMIWGDSLLAIYARDLLAEKPGSTVIFEVKCSQSLEEDILKHGGKPVMWKTGHSLIKKKMREENALLAGEMSGHQFFADRYFGFDDAIYAACRLLEIVSSSDRKLSEIFDDLPSYESTPEIRLECSDEKKFDVVREVGDHFKKTNEVIDIDGARVKFGSGWGLIRASNTQPVLVLRFEASDLESLDEIRKKFADALSGHIDVSDLIGQ
ncbi:MAG: phosphomannomutase/phosphoglucomutase [Bacteroidales bacterium]|nr:phosphomannomutase/phosphoglucomutase [Candidatus Latescibacterota bacterium]